jgi:hypothetical protein
MLRTLGAALVAVTLLAGCASSGIKPAFEFRFERTSQGRLTPVHEKVPEEVIFVGGPSGCVVCGIGVQSGGAGPTRRGWGTNSQGFPERVHKPVR